MLDDLDKRMVEILVDDARISVKELAQRVNLSSPSVSERLRRLEERGVIRSFTVHIDPQAMGYTLQATVRIQPLPGKPNALQELIEGIPLFSARDMGTGD